MLKVNKIVKVFKEKSLKRVGKGAESNVVFFNFKKTAKEARDFYILFGKELFWSL